MKRIQSILYLALPLLFLAWSCDGPIGNRNNTDPIQSAKGGGGNGGGETVEVIGNNLSFPVIWADGVTKTLRGTYLTEVFEGESFVKNDTTWYVQADPSNTWQAENFTPIPNNLVKVSYVDWGDNLEAKSWPAGSQVRIETVLYKLLPGPPMTAYRMIIEDESITGVNEVWGTSGLKYMSHEATIYSATARLVIQKLTKARDSEDLSLQWDAASSQWTGDANGPVVSSGVWTNISGPTAYSAEINVQGKLLYGYNWVTQRDGDGPGDYRITFVLEPSVPGVTCNTIFDQFTFVMVPEEETVTTEEEDGGSVSTGGVAQIDTENNLTYIDVRLTEGTGGGKKGGGQGSGKGNSGRGGSGSGGHSR